MDTSSPRATGVALLNMPRTQHAFTTAKRSITVYGALTALGLVTVIVAASGGHLVRHVHVSLGSPAACGRRAALPDDRLGIPRIWTSVPARTHSRHPHAARHRRHRPDPRRLPAVVSGDAGRLHAAPRPGRVHHPPLRTGHHLRQGLPHRYRTRRIVTTILTDRYVAATMHRVAGKHRREIDQELRAAIAETIEPHIEQGQSLAQAGYVALKELSEPARFAARYADRSAVLIGPNVYRSYAIALRLPCAIVIPVVLIVNKIGYWTRGDSVGTRILGPIGITLTAAMYLLVAVTAAFLVVDRGAVDGSDRSLASSAASSAGGASS